MFDKAPIMFFLGLFCGGILAATISAFQEIEYKGKFEADAIKAGVARYEVEGRNKTRFVWITQSKETTTP